VDIARAQGGGRRRPPPITVAVDPLSPGRIAVPIAVPGAAAAAAVEAVRKRIFLRNSSLRMIFLPRQARDKHRKS
jgi:hypothetical protein